MSNRNSSDDVTYSFGDFKLNSAERILFRKDERIPLTPRAFDLLLALVKANGHLLTKETLLQTVWADAVVEEGNLNRTISSIRKALGDTKGESRFIETVPKAGYRFVGNVETIPLSGGQFPTGSKPPPIHESSTTYFGSRKWMIGVLASILLIAISVAAYFSLPKLSAVVSMDNSSSSGMTRLTNNGFNEDQAEWTAEGKIRFIRFVTNTRAESWVMDADGSNQHRANDRIMNLQTGQWSNDGKQVVFVKEGEGPKNVYLANSDGSNERKLPLSFPPNDWSPDGKSLVYTGRVDKSNVDIFVYDISTDKSTNITNHPAFDADPLFSPDGKLISFVSSRDGNGEDYIMNADGTNVRRMTDHPAVDAFPSIAPDGTQIAFDSNREGENSDIYLKNINDDEPPFKITDLPSNEEHRSNCWSSDGTKMVITSDESGRSNIYVLNIEPFIPKLILSDPDADLQYPNTDSVGSKIVYQAKYPDKRLAIRVLDVASNNSNDVFITEPDANFTSLPVFSPDSAHIAFANKIGGNTEICLMNVDGTDIVNLTNNVAADSAPAFSPDGTTIYFQSNRDGVFLRFSVFRMNSDGTRQERLMNRSGYEFSPQPLPDGNGLVFSGDREDETSKALDIRSVDLKDPANEQVIAQRRYHDSNPTVSRDGQYVAFVAQSDGNSEIYLVKINGTGLLRLTRNEAEDISPVFSADSRSIIFSSNRNGKYAIYAIGLPH